MIVEYSSNNSGGSWWLSDKHWLALEAAGWRVEWGGEYFCHNKHSFCESERPAGKPEPSGAQVTRLLAGGGPSNYREALEEIARLRAAKP